ncbi:MAG: hypothetical protein KatS3mg105_1781 [Gemmatales bacterium]|nr:MAG: hypothetical protein KatS3mg105_1781 [Gemmatales bacterium]
MMPEPLPDQPWEAASAAGAFESPLHGNQGDRLPKPKQSMPQSITIAISREAGSRGSTIGAKVGKKLGWQVFNQELIEYIAQEGIFRQSFVANLPGEATQWAEERLQQLLREQNLSQHPTVIDLARTILVLGAQGDVVIVGRGAGCILPPHSTLHVRTVAPRADRTAYMAQWLRLTMAEAEEQVRLRDNRRAEFIATHFHRQPSDIYQYDLVLNTSLLGEELCTDLIVQAAKAKLAMLRGDDTDSPTTARRSFR